MAVVPTGGPCVAYSSTRFSGKCPNPAKGVFETGIYKGQPGCGVHLAGERRRIENDRHRHEMVEARAAAEKRSQERADALAARLGVRVWAGKHAGEISYADLEALAERLKLAEGGA